MEDISKIDTSEKINSEGPRRGVFFKKKQKKQKRPEEVKRHLKELTEFVEQTHEELEFKESPFRICVYQEEDDIFIDIVTIDETGKINNVFKHDITNDELEDIIQHIKSGRGLLLDADV